MLIWSIKEILLFPLSAWNVVVVVQSLITADSVQTHGLPNSRLLCLSLSPGVCSNSCPLRCWFYPTISSCVILFSCCPFSQHHRLFQWVSSLHQVAKVLELQLPMNIQGWFPLGLTGLISLLSKGFSSLLQHHISKASILWCSAFFMVQLSHSYMTTGKTMALTIQTFVGKATSLLFNTLSRLYL